MWQKKGPIAAAAAANRKKRLAVVALGRGVYTWSEIALMSGWKSAAVAKQTVRRHLKAHGITVSMWGDRARLSDKDMKAVIAKYPDDIMRQTFLRFLNDR